MFLRGLALLAIVWALLGRNGGPPVPTNAGTANTSAMTPLPSPSARPEPLEPEPPRPEPPKPEPAGDRGPPATAVLEGPSDDGAGATPRRRTKPRRIKERSFFDELK